MAWEMQTLEFTMFSCEGWSQIWLFSCLLSGSQNSGTSNEETRTLLIYRLIDPRVWERLDIQRILPTTVMSQFCKKARIVDPKASKAMLSQHGLLEFLVRHFKCSLFVCSTVCLLLHFERVSEWVNQSVKIQNWHASIFSWAQEMPQKFQQWPIHSAFIIILILIYYYFDLFTITLNLSQISNTFLQ